MFGPWPHGVMEAVLYPNWERMCGMKRTRIDLAAVSVAWMLLLAACVDGSAHADLVFVSETDTAIGLVAVECGWASMAGQNANSCPLRRGESFGFQVDSYPATVTVYRDAEGRQELASCIIRAEPAGGRWYVTARDRGSGVILELGGR